MLCDVMLSVLCGLLKTGTGSTGPGDLDPGGGHLAGSRGTNRPRDRSEINCVPD